MKLLLLVAACFAAAHGTAVPGYQDWCSNNFWIFPDQSSYCFDLPINKLWYTPQFYNFLKDYPQPVTGDDMCEAENTDIAGIISGYRSQLATKRTEFKCLLEAGLPAFKSQIDTLHAQFQSSYETNLQKVMSQSSAEYAIKVQQYAAELSSLKTAAVTSFNNAVTDVISKIKSYHDQLLANFESCLTNRKCRVESYALKLDEMSNEIQRRYAATLTSAMEKKESWVRSIFTKLYNNQIKQTDFEDAMNRYKQLLETEKQCLIQQFKTKIDAAVLKMKNSYRCNYKCYFNTGCYGFSRRSYTRSCTRMPSPPRYSYKLVGVSAFNPEWKGCPAPAKPTTPAEPEFKSDVYIQCIDDKAREYLSTLATKVTEWKGKVTSWKSTSLTSLKATISTMYPRGYVGQLFTNCEVEEFRRRLEQQAQTWLDEQERQLLAQITTVENRYKCQINDWSSRAKSFVGRVKQQYDSCIANKNQKIASYNSQLDQKVIDRRSQLYAKVKAMADQHKCLFNQFYQCSFGLNPTDNLIKKLKTEYESCVDQKVQQVMTNYDTFWCTEKPKLKEIYKCGFKCFPKISIPDLRINFQWNFCPPSLNSFQFYC